MEGDIEAYEGFHGIKTFFFSRREEIGYDIGYRRFQDPPNNAKKKIPVLRLKYIRTWPKLAYLGKPEP